MFINRSDLLRTNPTQRNYGVAVFDYDGDGEFELFVAGFGSRNLVLKWNGQGFDDVAPAALADPQRQAIGVAAGDIDGDGREEVYVLNTDTFMGRKRIGDRLFDIRDGVWTDLFERNENQAALNLTAGRSVACVDRTGDGHYGFFVANYGGPMRLYELNQGGELHDVAVEANLNFVTGGRGVIALPLVSERMDIFTVNERGSNFLFVNQGDGHYVEMSREYGLSDPNEHGRGVAAFDANDDGQFDLVYGNWEGPHRLFLRTADDAFTEAAPSTMAQPSRIRTVIVADFDNDGYQEIFFNNIGEPNHLFGVRNGAWTELDIGDAGEPEGLGTGAAIGDFDHDGWIELLVSHGESGAQPLSLFHGPQNDNAWLRVLPLTRYGAPARGATVALTASGRTQIRAIDAGSGYLCQMEPVAHFGLGENQTIDRVEVRWPDGATVTINQPEANTLLRVHYPPK